MILKSSYLTNLLPFFSQVRRLQYHLILKEIRQHQNKREKLQKFSDKARSYLYGKLGVLSKIYVNKFLDGQSLRYKETVLAIHRKKLNNLGLDLKVISSNMSSTVNAVRNLSNRNLSAVEYAALNRGLSFGILPSKFNFINVQAEFENFYHQVRPGLNNMKE